MVLKPTDVSMAVWHENYDFPTLQPTVKYTLLSPLNSGDSVSSLDSDGESSVSWETRRPRPSFSSVDAIFRRDDGGEQRAAVLPGREDVSEMLSS